jgi:hypothetical protein
MNQTTLTQVIEAASSLPVEDLRRLREWAEEKERQMRNSQQCSETLQQEEERFQKAMNWLNENREQYIGQWVALDGNRLISYGTNGKEVHAKALAAGVAVPILEHIVEEKYPFGGW